MWGKPKTKRELTFIQFIRFLTPNPLPICDCFRFGSADRLSRSLQSFGSWGKISILKRTIQFLIMKKKIEEILADLFRTRRYHYIFCCCACFRNLFLKITVPWLQSEYRPIFCKFNVHVFLQYIGNYNIYLAAQITDVLCQHDNCCTR